MLVTHFMDEAEALCDRVAVMRAGRLVDIGTPADLISRHARWATVRFELAGATGPAPAARPGVREVRRDGGAVEVHGDRGMVAYVCAELVAQRPRCRTTCAVVMPDLGGRAGRPAVRGGGGRAPRSPRTGAGRTAGATGRLVAAELRLVLREPLVLAFVFAFPVVTVLVIAGSFASRRRPVSAAWTRPTGTSRRTWPWSSPRSGW